MKRKRINNDDLQLKQSDTKRSGLLNKSDDNKQHGEVNTFSGIYNLQKTAGNQAVQQMVKDHIAQSELDEKKVQKTESGNNRQAYERNMMRRAIINGLRNVISLPTREQSLINFANSILSRSHPLSVPAEWLINPRLDINVLTELVREMQRDIDNSISPSEMFQKIRYYFHGVSGIPY